MTRCYFNNVLVPIDFSEASRTAFEKSLELVGGEDAAVIALHVIDESLLNLLSESELGDLETIISALRTRLGRQLEEFTSAQQTSVQVNPIVSVGMPFLEIIRKSEDFDVDAIVMGKVGAGEGFEKLLFGTTAERVLRGSVRPVIVFPRPASQP